MAYNDLCDSVDITKLCCIKSSLLIMNSFCTSQHIGAIMFAFHIWLLEKTKYEKTYLRS